MKIESITLNNFRQFYGKQTIKFSTDKEKNVTLIHAENGVGKTALLNAIRWCFFGETTQNFKDSKVLLNHTANDEGGKNFFVEIIFIEDNKRFTCRRENTNQNKIYFSIYENKESNDTKINEPDLFINSIIPKDMVDYFFFQGEGIGSLTLSNTGANNKVKSAIHKVLGFTVANQTLDDLHVIKKEYLSKIADLDKGGEITKLSTEISKLEEEIHTSTNRLEKCHENIAMYENKISELDKRLHESDHNVIKENLKQRKILEAEKKKIENELQTKQLLRKKIIAKYGFAIFGAQLASQALDFINEEEFKGTIPAPYNENLVNQILQEKNCICGAEIHQGSQAYQNIKKLLENAADPLQGNRVIRAREILKSIREKNKDAQIHLLANIGDISNLKDRFEKVKNQLEEISLKLANIQLDEISSIEKTRKEYLDTQMQESRAIGNCTSRIDQSKKELLTKTNRLNQIQSQSKDLVIYKQSHDILKQVENHIRSTLEDAEKSMVTDLPAMINNLLEKYVRQDYRASVNKDTYEIRLVDRQGRKVAESDGQQLLLSLTFISCLIELAAKRKNASGEILTPGAIAPFIIDAPFGVLDNKYKGNMAKSIPESVEQVVFLLSSSHWQGSVEENIRSRIGAEYNLVAEVKADQGSKDKYSIFIQGQEFDTVRYNCPVDRTSIEEVTA